MQGCGKLGGAGGRWEKGEEGGEGNCRGEYYSPVGSSFCTRSQNPQRGIAALSVVLCHLKIVGAGGFGVDLFFCISGFIMMFITEKNAAGFLTKRILRLCPLYYLLTIASFSMGFIAPALLRSPETDFLVLLLKSFFFIGGMPNGTVVGVAWTLCYEIFFYILFYISLKISHKNRHIITCLLLLVPVLAGIIFPSQNSYWQFYTRPILLEFALGMFAYKLTHTIQYNTIQYNTIQYNTRAALYV